MATWHIYWYKLVVFLDVVCTYAKLSLEWCFLAAHAVNGLYWFVCSLRACLLIVSVTHA